MASLSPPPGGILDRISPRVAEDVPCAAVPLVMRYRFLGPTTIAIDSLSVQGRGIVLAKRTSGHSCVEWPDSERARCSVQRPGEAPAHGAVRTPLFPPEVAPLPPPRPPCTPPNPWMDRVRNL